MKLYVMILSHMITDEALRADEEDVLEPVWKALANPIRRRILDLLRDGPQTTGALAAAFEGLSRFAIMQHLGVLEAAELIIPRREGRKRYNFLNPVPICRIYERWVRRYEGHWAETLLDLKRGLEGPTRTDLATG